MNIGIDVDGVLIDFEERFRYKAEIFDFLERKNHQIINTDSYLIEEEYNWSEEDWNIFASKYLIELTEESNIIPGVKEIINLLKLDGHKLFIISARGIEHEKMITMVEELFRKENLTFDKYYWKIKDKLEILKKENIDIMIDDNPNICKKLAENHIRTLYFRNVYGKKLEEGNYLKEVKNRGEVYRYIHN
jgi:uncharacterized HAD superfamily protein